MTPAEIVKALEGRGWSASIVAAADVDDLVEVTPDGLMKCVDGRPSEHAAMRGPKTLGGIYALASMRGAMRVESLAEIVAEVQAAGHVPSVHGDQHAEPPPMGCGFFKLWKQGKLDGLEPPSYSAEEGKKAVLDAGGVYETLIGGHEELEVLINLVPNTTFEPNAGAQRFVVDGWITGPFGLDVGRYLTLAAQTVELLSDLRTARIIVP